MCGIHVSLIQQVDPVSYLPSSSSHKPLKIMINVMLYPKKDEENMKRVVRDNRKDEEFT